MAGVNTFPCRFAARERHSRAITCAILLIFRFVSFIGLALVSRHTIAATTQGIIPAWCAMSTPKSSRANARHPTPAAPDPTIPAKPQTPATRHRAPGNRPSHRAPHIVMTPAANRPHAQHKSPASTLTPPTPEKHQHKYFCLSPLYLLQPIPTRAITGCGKFCPGSFPL